MDYNSKIYKNIGKPAQAVSQSVKNTKKWKEQNVDAHIGMSGADLRTDREKRKMKANYGLVNSVFEKEDFNYITNPYGMDGSQLNLNQPSKMRNYNLIVNKINLLKGEELSRPFNYSAIAVNGNAVTLKEKQLGDMVKKVAQMEFAKLLGEEFGNPPEMQEGEPQSFQELEKWKNYSLQDIREVWANDILKYLEYELDLHDVFQKLWEHTLISSHEIAHVGIVNGEPNIRICNPLYSDFDRNPSNQNIQDGDWFREDRYMTIGQIIDEYGEYLTEAEVKKLDKGEMGMSTNVENPVGFAYVSTDLDRYSTDPTNNNLYKVTTITWKSLKKIGFLIDPFNEEESIMVDETYKLDPELKTQGYYIDWTWIPEIWQGTKVEDDLYINIAPLEYQGRSMDNPRKVKLPYIGKVHNCTNTEPTSVVDLLKPFQYMYMITWFNLEKEINKAKGRKFVMDVAQIPKSEGIDMEKWMYLFDNMDIAYINSLEEGNEKHEKGTFNQFSSIDMTMSQSVGQYVSILAKIEQLIDKVVGITPQREGQTKASETASGTQAAIANSTYITEPWFYQHNVVKKDILTALLEVSKFAYKGKKKLQYVINDLSRVFMDIDMEKFPDSDYGVFITNSGKDRDILSKLERLAETALSSGMTEFSSIVDLLKTNSIAEISHSIKDAEASKQAREQQQQQQQIEAQQQAQQAQQQFEAEQNQLDRENKIQVAALNSASYDTDVQDSGKVEAFDYASTALEQSKLNSDNINKEKDRELKREEIKSKEKIEREKNKTALKNKVSGEK